MPKVLPACEGFPKKLIHRRSIRHLPALLATFSLLLLTGCGAQAISLETQAYLIAPNVDIMVGVPQGWHQVINSAGPAVPEMVAPISCMGYLEVSCATGLARTTTFSAPSAGVADSWVVQAMTASLQIRSGETVSEGPAKVGLRDGYRHRFTFTNPNSRFTAEVATVPTGQGSADTVGTQRYSVVMVWVSDRPGAPDPSVIDDIVGSVKVVPGRD